MPDPRSLDACVNAAAELSQVIAHAHKLTRAQAVFEQVVPAYLAAASRIANLRGGTLVIHADQGGVAAKLRQLSARLGRELLSQGLECNEIVVAVQGAPPRPAAPPSTPRRLTGAACESLRSLLAGLPAGDPLAAGIERLLQAALTEAGPPGAPAQSAPASPAPVPRLR